ncbi:hypothetical protein [Chitinivibrio alkaliphilus]|uniref:Uncharacterized protein n=1 Tax=Chitinivibrio alkaliphilus ACht1 TaxID=1313304 RepID=U7D7P6_9BACT|nr:hypothetical protein [Chitinivibrio alkaliphilus]ERP38975.1 hypothetical protein CALK_0466 [Chitinivibrio alkaliphilus ACht1]
MTNNTSYPDLLIPPFWGNSDILTLTCAETPCRALYAFFPLFREAGKLVVMDALEPGRIVAEIAETEHNRTVLHRFSPESDVLAIAAAAVAPEFQFPCREIGEFLGREIRRGLQLPDTRGELLYLGEHPLMTGEELSSLEREMTFKDRLGITLPRDASRAGVFFFVHNSQPQA